MVIALTGSTSKLTFAAAARRRPDAAPARHRRWRKQVLGWEPKVAARGRPEEDDRLLRQGARPRPSACRCAAAPRSARRCRAAPRSGAPSARRTRRTPRHCCGGLVWCGWMPRCSGVKQKVTVTSNSSSARIWRSNQRVGVGPEAVGPATARCAACARRGASSQPHGVVEPVVLEVEPLADAELAACSRRTVAQASFGVPSSRSRPM